MSDQRQAKAWDEARLEAFRGLMARAAEHERLAAMGAQDTERVSRWLAENNHPSYAQQAIAERALADQVAALEMPSELST